MKIPETVAVRMILMGDGKNDELGQDQTGENDADSENSRFNAQVAETSATDPRDDGDDSGSDG